MKEMQEKMFEEARKDMNKEQENNIMDDFLNINSEEEDEKDKNKSIDLDENNENIMENKEKDKDKNKEKYSNLDKQLFFGHLICFFIIDLY